MKPMHLLTAAIAANLAILAAPVSRARNSFLETATYTGVDTGETIPQDGRFVGAAFTLGGTEQITSIGAQFGGFPSGTIFAAIVSLASQTSLPSFTPSDIASNAIADVVFSVPMQPNGGPIDLSVPLNVTLLGRKLCRRVRVGHVRRRRLGRTRRGQQRRRRVELGQHSLR